MNSLDVQEQPKRKRTFLDLFPVPEFLLISTAGIVVTDSSTKFVRMRKELFGDGFKISQVERISNPERAVESGEVNNSPEMTALLKKLAISHDIRYAHATLPEEKAYLFTTSINYVPSESIRDSVAFIIEENVPMSLAESVFDYEIISKDRSLGKIRLAVSVLPKNIVDSYIKLFESAGVVPISFDLESQTIARAVVPDGDSGTYLIANLSRKKTGFYVVDEGVVQFSTSIGYGSDENAPRQYSEELKVEMRKVLAFWNIKTDSRKVGKILLCGSGAKRKDFIGDLMMESEVPYALANVWANTSASGGKLAKLSPEDALDYASVIGLSLPSRRK